MANDVLDVLLGCLVFVAMLALACDHDPPPVPDEEFTDVRSLED